MTSDNEWRRFKECFFHDEELGFSLDISRMSFEQKFLDEMQPRVEQAFRAMDELERGAIANPDENRMVGHYWLRAPELAPEQGIKREIIETNQRIKNFAQEIHGGKLQGGNGRPFTNFLLIGIGG